MCGIFGILSIGADGLIAAADFIALGERNTARGNLGFGGLIIRDRGASPATPIVYRFAEPFDGSRIPLTEAKVALGHVRAPTNVRTDDLVAIHPFETRELLLAHNGLLLNHAQFPAWQINPALNVDSGVIIGGIQHHLDQGAPIIEAIGQTVAVLDGQQACWLWHKPTGALYLWRVMSPIYVGRTSPPSPLSVSQRGGVIQESAFSVIREGASFMVIFSSVKDEHAQALLDEGMIYQLAPDFGDFRPIAHFPFYNPYRVR